MIPFVCIFSPCPLCSMSTILTGVVPLWDIQYLAKNSKGVQIPNTRAAVAKDSIFVTDDKCTQYFTSGLLPSL